jgi:hypothetical protein
LPATATSKFLDMGIRDDKRLSPEIRFYCDLVQIQSRAMDAFMWDISTNARAASNPAAESNLRALIKSYDDEVDTLSSKLNSDRSRFPSSNQASCK